MRMKAKESKKDKKKAADESQEMAEKRRIQAEAEKISRKIDDGVAELDQFYKMSATTTQSQKEKHEGEMRKEIQKLVKARELIKSIKGSADAKIKASLEEYLKNIEKEMEKFKLYEKEAKSKAPSKNEPSSKTKGNLYEEERSHNAAWLKQCISTLNDQLETHSDREICPIRKAKHKQPVKPAKTPKWVALHKLHVQRLTMLLHRLENEEITMSQLDEFRENFENYLKTYQETECNNIDEMYMDFHFDQSLDSGTDSAEPTSPEATLNELINDPTSEDRNGRTSPQKKSTQSEDGAGDKQLDTSNSSKSSIDDRAQSKEIDTNNEGATPTGENEKGDTHALLKEGKSARGVNREDPNVNKVDSEDVALSGETFLDFFNSIRASMEEKAQPKESDTNNQGTAPIIENEKGVEDGKESATSSTLKGQQQLRVGKLEDLDIEADASGAVATPSSATSTINLSEPPPLCEHSQNPLTSTTNPSVSIIAISTERDCHAPEAAKASEAMATQLERSDSAASATFNYMDGSNIAPAAAVPDAVGSDASLPQSKASNDFHEAQSVSGTTHQTTTISGDEIRKKNGSPYFENDIERVKEHVAISYRNCPTRRDNERDHHHVPRIPWNDPYPFFPVNPLENFDSPELFEQLDLDALFFVFYYKPGTYQQYLAARELKKKSWRFHKQCLAWFRRHDEPHISTESAEKGNYIYFDYKSADWCFRLENDFVFEYAYLENEFME